VALFHWSSSGANGEQLFLKTSTYALPTKPSEFSKQQKGKADILKTKTTSSTVSVRQLSVKNGVGRVTR
jgi:hypothetical protein